MCPYAQDSLRLGHNPENRDDGHNKRFADAAAVFEANARSGRLSPRTLEQLRAATPRLLPTLTVPSEEAQRLAADCVAASLEALRRDWLLALGIELPNSTWFTDAGERAHEPASGPMLRAPGELYPGAELFGLPLIGACCPAAIEGATLQLLAKRSPIPDLKERRRSLAVDLMGLIETEAFLTERAFANGGPSPRILYPHRYAILGWIVEIRADPAAPGYKPKHPSGGVPADPLATALCHRCGRVLRYHRIPDDGPPRCPDCADEPPDKRIWPENAVMPGIRGKWWLRCPGRTPDCHVHFEAHRNAEWCPACKAARISPKNRQAAQSG